VIEDVAVVDEFREFRERDVEGLDCSSDDRSGFVDTADDAAEFEDSDFDDGGDAGFDDTDYA
jgi:hypothetical protein